MNQYEELEQETLYDGKEPKIDKPYDPSKVDISSAQISIHSLLDRMSNDEIYLTPDYQRRDDVWDATAKSRLIESLLIRVPLPAFYFDAKQDNLWVVVDGLQRLSAFYDFVVRKEGDEKKLILQNMEYLIDLNGKKYEELPRQYQRRIQEAQTYCYIIRPGTPEDVTISIFKRINTGGEPLTLPEIRNAVYHGVASKLVRNMACSDEFKKATRNRVSPFRMEDADLTARFLAFFLLGYESYDGDMNGYIDKGMSCANKQLNDETAENVLNIFKESMIISINLFADKAFRKYNHETERFGPINKALFECTSVVIGKLDHNQRSSLFARQDMVEHYKELFNDEFCASVTSATGTVEHVVTRYRLMNDFFNKEVGVCE